MRRSWIGRALDGGPERLEERLSSATAQADWTAVFTLVRRLLRYRPDDVRLLNLGAAAVIRAERPPRGAVSTAIDWLQHANALAPGDVETLYQLGALARSRNLAAAEDYWRRAWTADPDHPALGDALRDLWVGEVRLPGWGLELAESRLLAADDAELQSLVLAAWEAGEEVSAAGYRLLRRWFFERGQRQASLVSVLSRELARLERYEEASREVFALCAGDDPEAARALVRCDARRRRFDPAAEPWYRAAAGEPEADLLLAAGILGGQLEWDATTSGAVARSLDSAEWAAYRLDLDEAVLRLAEYHLRSGVSDEGVGVVERARALRPDDARLLRYLADAYRPRTDPAALAVYEELFRAQATEAANVAFLAEGYLAGQLDLTEPRPVLVAYLGRRPADLALLLPAAKAWAERGAAAEDLVGLAQRLPAPERAELFDQLARHRFSAGDFGLAAELAAALVAVHNDEPARYKLAVCRARAGLAVQYEPTPRIAAVATCLGVLHGQPVADAELVGALEEAPATPGLLAARRVLGNHAIGDPLPLDPGDAALLSLAHLAAGSRPAAEAALDGEHRDRELLELWLALGDQPQAELAWRLLDQPAPWTAAQPYLLDLLARGGEPERMRALRPRLTRQQRLFVELRRIALAIDEERLEPDELERLAPALEPALADSLRAVAAEQAVVAALRQDQVGRAEEILASLATTRSAWLALLAAWRRGDAAQAEERLRALPEALLSDPAAAWEIALRQPGEAEAALARSLRHHRQRDDLRLGLAALNARTGRLDRFLSWATPLLEGPYRQRLAPVRRLLEQGLEAQPPDDQAPDEVALAAALAHLRRGVIAPALAWLAGRTTAEAVNLRAFCLLRDGQVAEARGLLASLPDSATVWHNRAVAAELAGGPAAATAAREAELAATTQPSAWQHRLLAEAYHALGRPADELAQLEAVLALQPDDRAARRARIDPLLRLGRAAEARAVSQAQLEELSEVDLRLDHAAVLAASDGAAAAVAWLEALAAERPELESAARQRRIELHARLAEQAAERAAAGDDLGLFMAAREAERLALVPDEVARAKLHQVVALGRLAEGNEAVARLEQALARSREVAASEAAASLRAQAERLESQVATRLARALVRQAAELMARRATQWRGLERRAAARPRHGDRLANGLAGAFDRILAMLDQADALVAGTAPAALRVEAERLAAAARGLAVTLGEEAEGG